MDLAQYYKVLAQQNNPNLSDEDVANSLKDIPQDKLQSALNPIMPPELSTDLTAKDPNTVGSSYDVNSSTDTVKADGGGLQPRMSKMDMDAAGIKSPAPEIPYGQNTPPADPLGAMPAEPPTPLSPSIPQQNAPIEQNTPESGSKSADKGAMAPSPLSSIVANPSSSDSQDVEKRQAMNDKNSLLKKVGSLSSLGAGIGDAIGNAAIPYGGKGSSGSQEKVMANTKDQIATNKEEFETKLKQDPTSDISKSYRQMVLQIAPDLAKNPNFQNMSAQAIGDKLPLIDTMMKARAQEDAKKLGLEQIRATKDLNNSYRQDQQQNQMEQKYREALLKTVSMRSGGLGQQDAKVNAAIHARQLIEGSRNPKTGEIELNQVATPELALTLANLVSGANSSSLETFKSMNPESLHKSVQQSVGYLFGKPVSVLPKAWSDSLMHMVDRQGLVSEQLRDHYVDGIKKLRPTGLDPKRAEQLEKAELGSSYSETFGLPKMGTNGNNPGAVPTVASQQDYDRLPSGASYKDANGKTYRKK